LLAGIFSHLKKSLFGNQLKNLEKGPFDGLNNLTRLDLGNNKLPEVITLLRDLHPRLFLYLHFLPGSAYNNMYSRIKHLMLYKGVK